MEVINRFKGLDLVSRVPEELWKEIFNIVKEMVTKSSQRGKKTQEDKWLSEEALHIAEEIKTAQRNINNLRYADDTTLVAESKEELNSLLMKMRRVKKLA